MTDSAAHPTPPSLVERMLAPGSDAVLLARVTDWIARGPQPRTILDVGAGRRSLLAVAGHRPIGIDRSHRRVQTFGRGSGRAIVASADALPVRDGTFDLVWSCGLLHHLSDGPARGTLGEIVRVLRPGGRAAIFDAVLPEPAWRQPLAWAVRRLDRGRFVRNAAALVALLPERSAWRWERLAYARTGLEGLWCTYQKPIAAAA